MNDMREMIDIIYGDISKTKVDGIICQSNTDLDTNDEITARLMKLGGDIVQAECNQIQNIQKTSAVVTSAGNLPAQYLIHTIMYNAGEEAQEDEMMLAIRSALNAAKEKMLKTISMPLIGESSGISIKRAAELMLAEVKRHLELETTLEKIFFMVNDDASYIALEEAYRQL